MPPAPPLFLARPSRFAVLPRRAARAALVALALLLVLAIVAAAALDPPQAATGQGDAALVQAIVVALADGRDYYAVALDLTRGAGPVDPLALPAPALPLIAAHLPGWLLVGLLAALALAALAVWAHRLQPLLRPTPHLVAVALLAAGIAAFIEPAQPAAAPPWGALLLLLALGLSRPGRIVEPAALGLAAALLCPAALLFLAALALAALVAGARREAAGWAGALVLGSIAFALHLAAIARLAALVGWPGATVAGPGFALAALASGTPLLVLPVWLAASLALLALLGWVALPGAAGARIVALFAATLAALAVAAPPDAYAWALLPAPLLLAGLAFTPDGLRDLVRAATYTRRITVTRRGS